MWTDGQTDMTKLIVAFRTFANAPEERLKANSNVKKNRLSEILRTA
jgi:hypothetical protein